MSLRRSEPGGPRSWLRGSPDWLLKTLQMSMFWFVFQLAIYMPSVMLSRSSVPCCLWYRIIKCRRPSIGKKKSCCRLAFHHWGRVVLLFPLWLEEGSFCLQCSVMILDADIYQLCELPPMPMFLLVITSNFSVCQEMLYVSPFQPRRWETLHGCYKFCLVSSHVHSVHQ